MPKSYQAILIRVIGSLRRKQDRQRFWIWISVWLKPARIRNQCCRSGMLITDPGSNFFPSRIPDPNCLHSGSRIRIKEFKHFNPKKTKTKWFLSSRKYDPDVHPGSGCWLSTHPGSRVQGSKKHRIPDLDPQHCPKHSSQPIPKRICSRASINVSKDGKGLFLDKDGFRYLGIRTLKVCKFCAAVLRIRNQDPVLFLPRYSGRKKSISGFRIRDPGWTSSGSYFPRAE